MTLTLLDVDLRCKKQSTSISPNCSNIKRLTDSSTCDNTEDPNSYLEPTLFRINESDFFSSSRLGDVSFIDDSIADAIDFGPKPADTDKSGMKQRTDNA